MKAAIYVRVSTGMQDEGLQRDELTAFATRRGYAVVAEFRDVASGARDERPGLEAMRSAARRGGFEVVLVWKLDRLGRSLKHLLGLLDELSREGVRLAVLRDSVDTTTAQGRLLAQLLGVFAQYERDLIRERCMAGQARARAAGKAIGRPLRSVDVAEARRLIAQGLSQRSTAQALGVAEATLRRQLTRAGR